MTLISTVEDGIVLEFMKDNSETLVRRGKQDARNYEAILNAIEGIVDRFLDLSDFSPRNGTFPENIEMLRVVIRKTLSAMSDAIRQRERKVVIYMVLACELALEELETLRQRNDFYVE